METRTIGETVDKIRSSFNKVCDGLLSESDCSPPLQDAGRDFDLLIFLAVRELIDGLVRDLGEGSPERLLYMLESGTA